MFRFFYLFYKMPHSLYCSFSVLPFFLTMKQWSYHHCAKMLYLRQDNESVYATKRKDIVSKSCQRQSRIQGRRKAWRHPPPKKSFFLVNPLPNFLIFKKKEKKRTKNLVLIWIGGKHFLWSGGEDRGAVFFLTLFSLLRIHIFQKCFLSPMWCSFMTKNRVYIRKTD